jgi:hypothetical protein
MSRAPSSTPTSRVVFVACRQMKLGCGNDVVEVKVGDHIPARVWNSLSVQKKLLFQRLGWITQEIAEPT